MGECQWKYSAGFGSSCGEVKGAEEQGRIELGGLNRNG